MVEHVPAETKVITKPDTVQTEGVVEANETVKPDEAVGATVNEPVASIWLAGCAYPDNVAKIKSGIFTALIA